VIVAERVYSRYDVFHFVHFVCSSTFRGVLQPRFMGMIEESLSALRDVPTNTTSLM
jgi:hypothetical protein